MTPSLVLGDWAPSFQPVSCCMAWCWHQAAGSVGLDPLNKVLNPPRAENTARDNTNARPTTGSSAIQARGVTVRSRST